jgi:hypothetical protein
MYRSLSPVREEDQNTSSSIATSSEDLPMVTPMTRSFSATIDKQNAENEQLRKQIAKLKATLQATRDELTDTAEVLATNVSSTHRPSTPPLSIPVPSSPLGLTPRLPRPQDVAYQAALKGQHDTAARQTVEEFKSEEGILKLFSKLANALTETNNSDVSTPPNFSGKDDEWETWYSQFRTY